MRWYKTISRILLVLSVANFALAAPIALRDAHDVRAADMADVAKDGTGASEPHTWKRVYPWSQWSTTNAADQTSPPRNPGPEDPEYPEHGLARLPPASPATSSIASNSVPSSPAEWNNNPASPAAWNHDPASPAAWNHDPASPGSPSEPHGGASPEYEYGGSPVRGSSWNSEWDSDRMTLSAPHLVNSDNPETSPSVNGPAETPPPQSSPAGSPPSTAGRPPPSPGPGVNPPPGQELQRPVEHESESFLEMLMKGKIRRHISGPVAAHG